MTDDPYLTYFGHPVLPAGFNADDNNGDEVDGAGTNWPIWPYLFDSFEALEVLIITPEMLEVFDGCADFVVPQMARDVPVPPEPMRVAFGASSDELQIPSPQDQLVLTGQPNLIVFPSVVRTLVITGEATKKAAA